MTIEEENKLIESIESSNSIRVLQACFRKIEFASKQCGTNGLAAARLLEIAEKLILE